MKRSFEGFLTLYLAAKIYNRKGRKTYLQESHEALLDLWESEFGIIQHQFDATLVLQAKFPGNMKCLNVSRFLSVQQGSACRIST